MTTSRDAILARVKEQLHKRQDPGALKQPAEGVAPPSIPENVVRQTPSQDFDALWTLFSARITALGNTALRIHARGEARQWLHADLLQRGEKSGIIDNDTALLLGLDRTPWDGIACSFAADREAAFAAGFGITLADFAVAETGSIAIASGPGRARLTSLAPPLHYALLPAQHLLPDMVDGLARQTTLGDSTSIVWVTGSSRTADIDGILIHGAHGPRELVVLLIEETM
jgi:L-lactate dehydrogenase complex protein LldG